MSIKIHALSQQLTGRTSVEECSLEEVQRIAQRYPYFAPAQFLLVQKLKEMASPDLDSQARKAVLFSPDPLLFEYFISSDKFYVDEVAPVNNDALQQVVEDNSDDTATGFQEELASAKANDIVEEAAVITSDEIENMAVGEKNTDGDVKQIQDLPFSVAELTNQPNFEEVATQELSSTNTDIQPAYDNIAQVEMPELIVTNNKSVEEEPKMEIAAIDQATAPQPVKEELTFEPFHTVDYFASQGIKISADGMTNDRLGKQLKSFTDWLKTMKRLPAIQQADQTELIAERKVENMASRSVSESNVVTEAMAEVWAGQGNKEKAAEIYTKLSLLNPSKKAFFAAKIENLKSF